MALLYLAADMSIRSATALLKKVGDKFDGLKTHMLTDSAARERAKILKGHGAKRLWQDFKGHDTPDTVAGRAKEFKKAGFDIVTVHASGGYEMMRQTVDTGINVYAVVFLTSLSDEQFALIYQPDAVERMIADAVAAGVAGLICPPKKVAWMRSQLQPHAHKPMIISPGTRFVDGLTHDQKQVETPGVTVRNGADALVIGRMVTGARNPQAAMDRLLSEIDAAMATQA